MATAVTIAAAITAVVATIVAIIDITEEGASTDKEPQYRQGGK
jgi:hypothetical protein